MCGVSRVKGRYITVGPTRKRLFHWSGVPTIYYLREKALEGLPHDAEESSTFMVPMDVSSLAGEWRVFSSNDKMPPVRISEVVDGV